MSNADILRAYKNYVLICMGPVDSLADIAEYAWS